MGLTRGQKAVLLYGSIGSVLMLIAGFLLGLVGHIGSLRHAAHVALVMAGIELLLWAALCAIVTIAWLMEA